MQNHFHTDAVQLGITALGVLVVFQLIRAGAGVMIKSNIPLVSAIGKGAAGLVTFSGS